MNRLRASVSLAAMLCALAVVPWSNAAESTDVTADDGAIGTPETVQFLATCPDTVQRKTTSDFEATGKLLAGPPAVEFFLPAGGEVRSCLQVVSRRTEPATFELVRVDMEPSPKGPGQAVYVDNGKWGLKDWITTDLETFVLQPGEEIVIPYTLKVPDNPSPGTNHGAIKVTMQPPETPGQTGNSGAGIAAALILQVINTTPGTIVHDVAVKNFRTPRAVMSSSTPAFRFDVVNEGNTVDHVTPTLKIKSALIGAKTWEIPGNEERLIREGGAPYTMFWDDRPLLGYFKPTLTVESDGKTLTKELDPVILLPPLWYLIVGGFVLLLPVFYFLYRWLRYRNVDWDQYLDEDWHDGDGMYTDSDPHFV